MATTIYYQHGRTTLGDILVGSSDRGICALLIGDDSRELRAELGRRFPRARLVADDARASELQDVVRLVEEPGMQTSLPLDVRGTAFQQRVWEVLKAIPAGRTATYAEVAESMGRPGAYRAVANACRANPLAVLIPCHRVVRSDGGRGGYRWGIDKKEMLLARESAASTIGQR